MFTHPSEMMRAAQVRREQYLAEAERARLPQMVRPQRPSAATRLRWALGNRLIAAGERLRREVQVEFVASASMRL